MRDSDFRRLVDQLPTRRTVLQLASVGLVTAAGCTTEANTSGGAGPGGQTNAGGQAGQPGSVEALAIGLSQTFADLDPTTASQLGTIAINAFIYEGLYRLDPFPPRTKVTPELAAGPPTVNGRTALIPLRKEARFHDGSPVTADDVVFTIERMLAKETKSLFTRFLTIIEGARATSPIEVQLTLKAPTTLLQERLALIRVLSKSAVGSSPDTLKLKPVGSGPLSLSSAVSNQSANLERAKDYNGDRKIQVAKVEAQVIADPNARISALRAKRSHVAADVSGASMDPIGKSAGLKAESVPSYLASILLFHCSKPPFDNVKVRQAVLYAIDRDAITRTSFFGRAKPSWNGYIREDSADYAKPSVTFSHDPGRAKGLLAEAGLAGWKVPIDFLVGNLEFLASQGPAIQQNLRDVGFEPNLIPGEVESLYSRVSAGTYNMFLAQTDPSSVGGADAEFLLRWLFYGALPKEFVFWQTPQAAEVERLLDAALTSQDERARRDALAKVQDIVQVESPIASLHHKDQNTAWVDTLHGFRPSPSVLVPLEGVRAS